MLKKMFLLICLLLLTNVQAGELYRSIDKDGKVHYSDTPLEGSEDFEKLKSDIEPTPTENLPYELQQAAQNFPVTLYVFPACGSFCQQARDFLSKRGIPYTEKSLVKKEDIETFRKESGDNQFPTLAIGKTWLKGFQEAQWNNELDFAGYPKKVITYRPPVPASAPAQAVQ
jgi:glutaredoxin